MSSPVIKIELQPSLMNVPLVGIILVHWLESSEISFAIPSGSEPPFVSHLPLGEPTGTCMHTRTHSPEQWSTHQITRISLISKPANQCRTPTLPEENWPSGEHNKLTSLKEKMSLCVEFFLRLA